MPDDMRWRGVVWITGLSGVGKSTIAAELRDRLLEVGITPVVLDGDQLRGILPAKVGYERDDRRKVAMFYAQLSHQLANQGNLVICATVSLLHEVHEWNREHTAGYREVLLRIPLEELRKRGCRPQLYGQHGDSASPVVGVDINAEFPVRPDLVVDN